MDSLSSLFLFFFCFFLYQEPSFPAVAQSPLDIFQETIQKFTLWLNELRLVEKNDVADTYPIKNLPYCGFSNFSSTEALHFYQFNITLKKKSVLMLKKDSSLENVWNKVWKFFITVSFICINRELPGGEFFWSPFA